jgi:hypothetical protein
LKVANVSRPDDSHNGTGRLWHKKQLACGERLFQIQASFTLKLSLLTNVLRFSNLLSLKCARAMACEHFDRFSANQCHQIT